MKFGFIWILLGLISASAEAARVICLAPSACEWSAEILGEKDAREQIVAITEWTNFPEYLKSKPSVGPYIRLNLEKVISMKPDLLVASKDGNDIGQIERLRRLGMKVHVMESLNIETALTEFEKLSDFVGARKGAGSLDAWKRAVSELKATGPSRTPRKILVLIDHNPLIAAGLNTFYTSALEMIGMENVLKDSAPLYPRLSWERIIKLNPDWIVDVVMDPAATVQPNLSSWKGQWITMKGDDFGRVSFRFLKQLSSLKTRATSP